MNEPLSTPCPEWEEKLTHLDPEALSALEREELDSHLQTCAACAAVYADYQRMDKLIDLALTSDLPLELPWDLLTSEQDHMLEPQHEHPSSHIVKDHYHLKHMIEKGHLAHKYMAEHIHLNRPVVVKMHHGRYSEKEKQNFHIEAAAIANLKHSSILPVLDFGIHEEKPFLVMEHAPHGSLRQRHPRGLPVPLSTVVIYVKQIAEALQYAHDRNIIHRNVRPENILIGDENQMLLADFGIPALESNSDALTHPWSEAHFYMAPEQFQGSHHVASDQYALAVMTYELLSGERPFYGSAIEIADKHRESTPPPLREKVPALSPLVEQVIFKALAKKPEMRFYSVREFATTLEEAGTDSAEVNE